MDSSVSTKHHSRGRAAGLRVEAASATEFTIKWVAVINARTVSSPGRYHYRA